MRELSNPICIIFKYAIPAIIEFALQALVQYIDLWMVGSLGVKATAVVGLASQVQFVIKFPAANMATGVLSYAAKKYGERDGAAVKRASTQALYYSMIIGLVFSVLAVLLAFTVPVFMGFENKLRVEFRNYFIIAYSSLLFFVASSILGSLMRSVGYVKEVMIVNGLVDILDIIFNYFFIFPSREIVLIGKKIKVFGFGLGVDGAAVGTALSIAVGGVLILIMVKKKDKLGYEKAKPDPKLLWEFFKVGIPSALNGFITGFGRVIFTTYVSALGTLELAAHSIAYTTEAFFYIPAVGMERAVAPLVGQTLGEKDDKKLNSIIKLSTILAMGSMLLLGIILFVYSRQITATFSSDKEIVIIAAKCLRIVAFSEPIFALSLVMQGVFEGAGRTKEPFYIGTFTMWFSRVALCGIGVKLFGAGLDFVWYCMVLDNFLRAMLLTLGFVRIRNKSSDKNKE